MAQVEPSRSLLERFFWSFYDFKNDFADSQNCIGGCASFVFCSH
jgi:hypothetical protein